MLTKTVWLPTFFTISSVFDRHQKYMCVCGLTRTDSAEKATVAEEDDEQWDGEGRMNM